MFGWELNSGVLFSNISSNEPSVQNYHVQERDYWFN